MKFYRVSRFVEHGNSAGFGWHTSREKAEAECKEWREQTDDAEETEPEIEIVEVVPTKKGILRALRLYANHPDNG
jgi:hypothetical protein